MIEFVAIVALIVVGRRLQRATRQPQRPIEIHIYHHFPAPPGERHPEEVPAGGNVVPFRRRV
jgi:hypothetical protein